jgi:ATP-dependent DNA ligase
LSGALNCFDRLRYGRQPQSEAVLFAFDLLELGGKDLRRTQLEERKGVLAKLVRKASWPVQLNEHIAEIDKNVQPRF